jgi:hypothetical protein
MQQIARARPLVGFAGSRIDAGRREIPARHSTFQTVECAKPVAPATSRGPQPVSRRQAQISSANSGASNRGERRGQLERSSSDSGQRSPSIQRCHHRWTVAGETLNAAATVRIECPSATLCTSARRPAKPSLALACTSIRALLRA